MVGISKAGAGAEPPAATRPASEGLERETNDQPDFYDTLKEKNDFSVFGHDLTNLRG